MEIYEFRVRVPADACEPLNVLVAAERATHAARTLREAGVRRVSWQDAHRSRDADGRAVALAEPGVIFWCPWGEEPRTWRRVPPGAPIDPEHDAQAGRCPDR